MPRATTSPRAARHRLSPLALAAAILFLLPACAAYVTPGGPANFRALGITHEQADAMTDTAIAVKLGRQPAAAFPASIAAVRIQAGDYQSHTYRHRHQYEHRGQLSIITVRDVESDDAYQRLANHPMIAGIAPANRLVVPARINTERDLRQIAAELQADILLLYTFDTVFGDETIVPALGTITLGLFPAKQAQVTSTASGAFIDTRTGFIYGLAEATSQQKQLANAWTTTTAIDQSRRRAEADAFDKLITQLERTWDRIATRYGPPPPEPGEQSPERKLGDAQNHALNE